MILLGVIDDIKVLNPWWKIAGEVAAACVLYAYGLGIPLLTNPFGDAIATGSFDLPLTVIWVLVVVNAINLIDGLDGLASGAVFIAAVTLWLVGRTHGDFYVMFVAVADHRRHAAGSCATTSRPPSVFMGDTGSHFLGLMLAAAVAAREPQGHGRDHAAVPAGGAGAADRRQRARVRAPCRRGHAGVPRRQPSTSTTGCSASACRIVTSST